MSVNLQDKVEQYRHLQWNYDTSKQMKKYGRITNQSILFITILILPPNECKTTIENIFYAIVLLTISLSPLCTILFKS